MLRDRADFVTLLLMAGGVAALLGAAFGWLLPPAATAWIVVGGIGLVLALASHQHLDLNRRTTWEHIERSKQETTALYLANAERERKLAAQTPKPPPTDYRQEWAEACHRFMVWGFAAGRFSRRRLADTASPYKCTSWDDWPLLVEVLAEFDVLVAAGDSTRAAEGMTPAKWEEMRHVLPYPTDRTAPKVAIPVVSSGPNTTNTPPLAV